MEAAGLVWIFSPLCLPVYAVSSGKGSRAAGLPALFLPCATLGTIVTIAAALKGLGVPLFWSLLRGRYRAARTPPPLHPSTLQPSVSRSVYGSHCGVPSAAPALSS